MLIMTILREASWVLMAVASFHAAVQHPPSCARHTLSFVHFFSIAMFLSGNNINLVPFPEAWVPFVAIALPMQTASILFLDRRVITHPESATLAHRLTTTRRLATNFRRLPPRDRDGGQAISVRHRCVRILVLLIMHRISAHFVTHTIRHLGITLGHFGPANQGIWLNRVYTYQDLYLRIMLSYQWIWSTYVTITLGHDICALIFVNILRRDTRDQWPEVFGKLTEAYTLRRFWGMFWHRLHVELFRAWTSSDLLGCRWTSAMPRPIKKALRAFWIFTMSALCHAVMNWIMIGQGNTMQELKFFLSNFALCLVETIIEKSFVKSLLKSIGCFGSHLLGYTWVCFIFFCLVPGWQYSMICSALSR